MPDNAPVGPIILNELPPNNAPRQPAQTAVMMPWLGVAPEEIASARDRGILTRPSVKPDNIFFLILNEKKFMLFSSFFV